MGIVNEIMGIEGARSILFAGGVVAKATVLVAVAALAARLLVRASAAARHMVWVSAIGGALLLPLLAVATPWSWGVLPAPQSASPVAARVVIPEAASLQATSRTIAVDKPSRPVLGHPKPVAGNSSHSRLLYYTFTHILRNRDGHSNCKPERNESWTQRTISRSPRS